MQHDSPKRTSDAARLRALLLSLAMFDAVAFLAGWSRMRTPAWLLQPVADVLRWREALSMLLFAAVLTLLLWRVFVLVNGGDAGGGRGVVMVAAVYFLGVGMGMHDPADLLGKTYAHSASSDVLRSLSFFDDRLGHYVFWAGFVLATAITGLAQAYHPYASPLSWRHCAALVLLGLPMLGVMWHNLVQENTGRDLCVIVGALLLVILAQAVHRVPLRRAPIFWYLYPTYGGAVVLTLASWAWRG